MNEFQTALHESVKEKLNLMDPTKLERLSDVEEQANRIHRTLKESNRAKMDHNEPSRPKEGKKNKERSSPPPRNKNGRFKKRRNDGPSNPSASREPRDLSDVTYYTCNKKGHYATDCHSKAGGGLRSSGTGKETATKR